MSDTITLPEEKTEEKTKRQPPYHVILLNDDDHTYQYVIFMLQKLFGHPPETGFKMAEEVDKTGRVIVDTTSRERAELKQEQIHAFGPDPLLPRCQGSMSAVIEPAE
jgi:ATP-dependent Clp protease adaptor protein ClpS